MSTKKINFQGTNYIIEYGINTAVHVQNSLSLEQMDIIRKNFDKYINEDLNYEQLVAIFKENKISEHSCNAIKEILKMAKNPTPNISYRNVKINQNHHWSKEEDIRLYAAVLIYGAYDWSTISLFVSNYRSRAQCSQRWNRTLNPFIRKDTWTPSEEEKLLSLTIKYKPGNWSVISKHMKNRSDVQCRYHYNSLLRKKNKSIKTKSPPSVSDKSTTPETIPQIAEMQPIPVKEFLSLFSDSNDH